MDQPEKHMKSYYRPKTKIICTLGPSSQSEKILRKMVLAGMDAVRINFSHGNYSDYVSRIETVRKINKKYRRAIKILGDLEGPRVRIGRLKKPMLLENRRTFYFVQHDVAGEKKTIPFDYEGSLYDLRGGEYIYIDDGNIVLKIRKIEKEKIKTIVVTGGILKQRKGVNIPGAQLKFPSITEKDKADIEFAMEQRFDYIAQSFVRNKKDILEVRTRVEEKSRSCKVIAKIENREGIGNIDRVMEASDGIMIARGDMGVCVPIYQIPIIQKEIIRKCNTKKKFVITATQMLEHMVENPMPRRAEVTDVANAVIDGTDFVMLSAETAIGKFPAEAVTMMNQIIRFTEKSLT